MKVMVVDDDPDVIFVLQKILQRYGCEVIGVTDSEKCLPLIEEKRPDILFLDVMMPGIDGWEICKKVKEKVETSKIYISMLTVRAEEEDKAISLKYAGANQHLCKPINFDEIKETIEGVKIGRLNLRTDSESVPSSS